MRPRFLLPLSGCTLDLAEDLGNFTLEDGEFKRKHGAAWMQDHIHGRLEQRQVFTDSFAHASLDAIAIDGLAQNFANSETDTRRTGFLPLDCGSKRKEVGHLLSELFTARLVNALIISMFAKAEGDGEHGGNLSSVYREGSRMIEQAPLLVSFLPLVLFSRPRRKISGSYFLPETIAIVSTARERQLSR